MLKTLSLCGTITCVALTACNAEAQSGKAVAQAVLGQRSAPILTVDGQQFKDLDRNGVLDPYEDWRLSPAVRAADLVKRMSLAELAGLMVHGTLPTAEGPMGSIGVGQEYDLVKVRGMILEKHANTFITRLSTKPELFAKQNNAIQEVAEAAPWGIPVTISSDPRNHFGSVLGAGSTEADFSHWPNALGLAAANDEALTRSFGDVVRQEYLAVGLRESLAPQADLATEPRWARSDGTFGEDAEVAKRMVRAYVAGIQNGDKGLNAGSVIAVVKHWAGYGAAKDGWDGHNFYGRFATFPGNNFKEHLIPFTGAFEANVAGVMPTYAILENLTLDGKPVEQVGAGFNSQLLNGLLRTTYGFKGVVVSDWGITSNCNRNCHEGAPAGTKAGTADIGMPWGVENLTQVQRFAKSINAGVDQVGGTDQSDMIVDAVKQGLLSEARVHEAAQRILEQKFAIGIFEQPYVDENRAGQITGSPTFVKMGETAQVKAVVLLQNEATKGSKKPLLPLAAGKKVYLNGVSADAATRAGFVVVTNPAQADVAIFHVPAPFQSEHTGNFFGGRQHEGRLNYNDHDAAYVEFLRVSATVPTIFVTNLERPILLKNVVEHSTALFGEFGIVDDQLLRLISGKALPTAHLPFELPSSMEAVLAQKSDVPHDSKDPLFPIGFGLKY